MKKRLYLHIGVHRTGTTSIQNWLHANLVALRRQGVRYAFGRLMHTDLAWKLHSGKLKPERFISDLVRDAAGDDIQSVVVSGEDFSVLRKPEILADLKTHFDVTVVCYLRRQDQWMESWYNQHVKWPWNRELSQCDRNDFLAERPSFYWIDYADLLARWSAAFGREHVVPRVFERGRLDGSLTRDFARTCGINADALTDSVAEANDSAPPQAVEFLRHLDLYDKHGAARLVVVRTVVNTFRARGRDTVRHFWSERERRKLVDAYSKSNAQVAEQWFGAEPGAPLFEAPLPGDDNAQPDIGLPPAPELYTEIVIPVIQRLLNNVIQAQDAITPAQRSGQATLAIRLRRAARLALGYIGRFIPGADIHADRQLYALLAIHRLPPRKQDLLIDVLEATRADRLKPMGGAPPDQEDPVDVTRRWVEPIVSELANRFQHARQAQMEGKIPSC